MNAAPILKNDPIKDVCFQMFLLCEAQKKKKNQQENKKGLWELHQCRILMD